MKLLLVEDHDDVLELLQRQLADSSVDIVRVKSRDEAFDAIGAGFFDLIVVDLSIPPEPGSADDRTEHGIAVFEAARAQKPGTPVVICSAYGASVVDELGDLLAREPDHDFLGGGKRSMALHRSKGRLDELIVEIRDHAEQLRAVLSDAEIDTGGERVDLDPFQERLLLIHARRYGAKLVHVRALAGGRSQAKTLYVELEGSAGDVRGAFVAKLNTLENTQDELRRHERWVRPYLPAGSYTNSVESQMAGAGNEGALFYAVAAGEAESLFALLPQDDEQAGILVAALARELEVWDRAAGAQERLVSEIRDDFVSLERLRALHAERPELYSESVEALQVAAKVGPVHGDLHGGNVLIGSNGTGILIDFGSAYGGSRATDPVTLELSVLLHADAPDLASAWPSEEQAYGWPDLDAYLVECPVPRFVGACRAWLRNVQRGDREANAVVYAYAVQQMTFPSIREGRRAEIAAALASGALSRLSS